MTDHVASLKSKHKFSLNWGYLTAITNGMSAIDLSSLALRNMHDARQFAREYGFDPDQPATMARIVRGHREAVEFIISHFLDAGQAALMPAQVRLAEEVQLATQVDVTVLADRFQDAPFEQGRDQFVDRGFRAADAAGDIIRAQGLADFLEKIEDIERPVQALGAAFDGVFGHGGFRSGRMWGEPLPPTWVLYGSRSI